MDRPYAVVAHSAAERLPRIISTQATLDLAQSLRSAMQDDRDACQRVMVNVPFVEYSVADLAADPEAAALAAAFEAERAEELL